MARVLWLIVTMFGLSEGRASRSSDRADRSRSWCHDCGGESRRGRATEFPCSVSP